MSSYPKNWFLDAKYGLFIHFGLYSLLGGEYRGKVTPFFSEWIMNDLNIPLSEYEQLAAQFDPFEFDADKIAESALRWGTRYLCFTAKHHDGFALFGSSCSDYNSVCRTPSRRDYVSELAEACRKKGIVFCLYYSQAQDWHHPDGYVAYHDNQNKNFRRYLDEKCLPQLTELLSDYGPIGMMWFDTPMGMKAEECEEIYQLVKKLQPDCLVSGRIGNGLGDYFCTQDNRLPAFPLKRKWEIPGTLNRSFGYKKSDTNWDSAETVIRKLVKIVSRGGNYLLNVGPDGSGKIPQESTKIMDEAGEFLSENGEAFYGAEAVPPYVYETPDIYFTHKPHRLFLTVFHPGQFPELTVALPNIANIPQSAKILRGNRPIAFNYRKTLENDSYWEIFLPPDAENQMVVVICVETQEADVRFELLDG